LSALRRVLEQSAHLLGPIQPAGALEAVLLSRTDGIGDLEPARARLAADAVVPRLVNRWRPPDQPHPALLRVLPGHHRRVNDLAVPADGSWLAAAGLDETLRVWDVADGRVKAVLTGHVGGVDSCAAAPDGTWLASGGSDGTVRVWDLPAEAADDDEAGTGPRLTLTGHVGPVFACLVVPSGETARQAERVRPSELVSVGADGTLRRWGPAGGVALATYQVSRLPMRCVAAVPGTGHLACGVDDGSVVLVDVDSGEVRATLAGHRGQVLAVAVSADAALLATAGQDGTVRLWDLPARRQLRVLGDGGAAMRGVAIAPDGTLVAAGWEGITRIWDATTWAERPPLTGPTGGVAACVVAPDGSWLATGGRYGAVRIWDLRARVDASPAGGRDEPTRACAASPDGATLVGVADDGTATAWDVVTGQPGAALAGEPASAVATSGHRVRSSVFASDGSWVAVPGSRNAARLWDPASGTVKAVLDAAGHAVLGYAVAPDNSWLAGACEDGTVRLWETATGEWLASFTGHVGPVHGAATSPDGRLLATGGEDRTVRVWDVATLEQRAVLTGHTDAVLGCAASGDGSWFVSTGADHTVRVWDAATGACLAVLREHSHTVRGAAFSPDGAWLASAGGDGSVRVWASADWRCVAAMRFEGAARSCCWLPGSTDLAVAGGGGLYLYTLVTS
jgi:WD40 repeat protein